MAQHSLAVFSALVAILSHSGLVSSESPESQTLNPEDYLTFTRTPAVVVPGLTKLGLLCSVPSKTWHYKSVISIVLMHWNETRADYTDVASVDLYNPDDAIQVGELPAANVRGKIELVEDSYLGMEWVAAPSEVSGTYVCEVNVFGTDVHPLNLTGSLEITMGSVDLDVLLSEFTKVRQLEKERLEDMARIKQVQENQLKEMSELKQANSEQMKEISNLKQVVKDLNCDQSTTADEEGNDTTIPNPSTEVPQITVVFCDKEGGTCNTTITSSTYYPPSSNVCFKVASDRLHWHDAKDACIENGGRLAEVHDKETLDLLFYTRFENDRFFSWLGASDEEDKGEWRWLSGDELKFDDWYEGQNDNIVGQDGSDCLALAPYQDMMYRMASACNAHLDYVCEASNLSDCAGWAIHA